MLLFGSNLAKINIFIFSYLLIHISNQKILNLARVFQPLHRKILIYGSFEAAILSRVYDVKLCDYYPSYEIKWSNNIKDFDFDVVVLYFDHHFRFMKEYLKIPSTRKRTMIVASFEAPFSVKVQFNYQISKDHFNHWTLNYYRSSFFTITYGDYDIRKSSSISNFDIEQEFKTRKNAAFCVISNCEFTKSKRLDYIIQLQRYFEVETLGKCFTDSLTSDGRNEKMSTYKFFIAAENSHCPEYTTEKYWADYIIDSCKFLGKLTEYLNRGDIEDPNIHKITNEKICISQDDSFNLL
ncbi:hypothetical protein MXB_943, partial [Myxobolus squamalis]